MRFILIGILFTILFFTTSLKAQDGIDIEKRTYIKSLMCAKHEDLTGNLEQQHGEARKWWAINSQNEIVELFVNDENGAWTIIITNNKQMSCALIGGDHSGANYDIDSSVE
jgi:hypothetical protein